MTFEIWVATFDYDEETCQKQLPFGWLTIFGSVGPNAGVPVVISSHKNSWEF
jgi:hypothetical protein